MREIFLVEDSESDAELLKRVLNGLNVLNPLRHVLDGGEAMAYFRSLESATPAQLPTLLFLDIKLPRASGFEILTYLEMKSFFRPMLKVVVSDLDDMESIRTAYALGAQAFLCKPVHKRDLEELLKLHPELVTLAEPGQPPVEKVGSQ